MRVFNAAIALFLAAALPSLAQIRGAVVSSDGRPVAGAAVAIYAQETMEARNARIVAGAERAPLANTVTDDSGRFAFDPVTAAVVDLEISSESHAPLLRTVDASEPVGTLSLRKAAVVSGRVTIGGKPAKRAAVIWSVATNGYTTGIDSQLIVTGDDGTYRLPDPKVWAHGALVFHPDAALLLDGPSETQGALSHTLEKGTKLQGRVVDARTKSPIESATVYSRGFPLARSKADGFFTIEHLASGEPSLFAVAGAQSGIATRKDGEWIIELQPSRTITGVVTDDQASRSVAGARVMAYSERLGTFVSAFSDAKGKFEISNLPAAEYAVFASRPHYSMHFDETADNSGMVDVRKKASQTATIRMRRDREVRGKVVDGSGKAVAGAMVWIGAAKSPALYGLQPLVEGADQVLSDADGSFVLKLAAHLDGEAFASAGGTVVMAIARGFPIARTPVDLGALKKPLSIVLPVGLPLKAVVRDRDGKPVAGAAIAVAEVAAGYRLPLRNYVERESVWPVTNEAGELDFRLNRGMHDVAVRARGFAVGEVKNVQHGSLAKLEVTLDPGAAIRGRIVHANGNGVAGVTLFVENGEVNQRATSGADGSFAIVDLPAGRYVLVASKRDDFLDVRKTVSAPVHDLRIDLPPSATLRGRVKKPDGDAVGEFTLGLKTEASEVDLSREVRDASGVFEIANVPYGAATLSISAPWMASHEAEVMITENGAEVDVTLEPGVIFSGRVLSPSGDPVIGTAVELIERSALHQPRSVESDESGEFTFGGLRAGKYLLRAVSDGFAAYRSDVEIAGDLRRDIILSRGLTLQGGVYSGGAPVANAQIYASSSNMDTTQSAESGANGEFTIVGLTPGRYSITAHHEKSGTAEMSDVDVATASKLRLDLEKALTGRISGRVVNLPSEDASMRYVYAETEDGSDRALIDQDGTYELSKVPAGTVKVTAFVQSERARRLSRPHVVDLAAGAHATVDLEFTEGITLRGVVTRDGLPVLNAHLNFTMPGNEAGALMARSDQQGRYELAGLEPGRYDIQIYDSLGGYQAWRSNREVRSSGELNFDVTGATVRGRVIDAETRAPIKEATVRVWSADTSGESIRESRSDARGAFTEKAIADGRYRVVASSDGYGQESEELDLYAGVTREVTLTLRKSSGMNVSIVDARDGKPLNGYVVVRDRDKRMVSTHYSEWHNDGAFRLPLAAGSYFISVSSEGYGSSTVAATSPSEVKVPVTPGGTLVIESRRDLRGRVKLVRPDGEEYVQCWCNGIAEMLLRGSRTVIEHVTPGAYSVQLLDELGARIHETNVQIREAQSATITVE